MQIKNGKKRKNLKDSSFAIYLSKTNLFNRTTNRVYRDNVKQLKYVKNKKIISI